MLQIKSLSVSFGAIDYTNSCYMVDDFSLLRVEQIVSAVVTTVTDKRMRVYHTQAITIILLSLGNLVLGRNQC